jgi:hypothetical protein
METRTYNGVTYQRSAPGQPWQRVGAGQIIPQSPTKTAKEGADASKAGTDAAAAAAALPYVAPNAAADLEGQNLSNEEKRVALMEAKFGKLSPGYRWKADGTGAERIPGLAPDTETVGANQKLATLQALRENIARVRSLYEKNLKGGAPNQLTALVPDMLNPSLGQFDAAGAGLSETGLAAFRVPGVGSQSDTELRAFVDANRPKSTDSDLKIEEKLRNLETRLNATLQAMGSAAAIVQPKQEQAAPPPIAGKLVDAGGGGTFRIPELAGLGAEVARMIKGGASDEDIIRYVDQRGRAAGRPGIPQGQADFIRQMVAKHRENPAADLNDIGNLSGLEYEEKPSDGGSMAGQAALTPLGAGAMSAANAVTFGNLANIAGGNAGDVLAESRQDNPYSSFAGDLIGSGVAMGGLGGIATKAGVPYLSAAITRGGGIGGDMLYGGVRGASETQGDIGDKAKGGLFGLLSAGGGNLLGRGIVSTAGRAARGVSNEAVRMLNDRGISMTPGQILGQDGWVGRRLGTMENALESVPFIGGNIRDRRMQGIGDYGRAQLEENLGSIGFDALGGQFDGSMLGRGQQAVNNAYRFLDDRTFQADPQFVDELAAALAAGRTVPRVGDEFGAVMDRQISPLLPENGVITGRGFQDALQTLRGARSEFAQDGSMGAMAGDAVGDVEAALMGLVGRQAPDVTQDLARANQAYAGLVPIENASISATNAAAGANRFTPAQYGRAAANNTRKFGGRAAAARGDIPGGDLQRAAQEVLPSELPNSGTADRAMAAMLLPAAFGGGAVAAQSYTDDPLLTAVLLGLGGATTRTGQRAIQRALVDRPDIARNVGDYVYQLRDIGGRGGGVLGASAIPWLLTNE